MRHVTDQVISHMLSSPDSVVHFKPSQLPGIPTNAAVTLLCHSMLLLVCGLNASAALCASC